MATGSVPGTTILFVVSFIVIVVFAMPGIAKETYSDVKFVHVITSCHLDIGFKTSSAGILNLYFDHHFPLAVSLGKQIRRGEFPSAYQSNRLNFMFQAWVVSMYLDCPENMGLHCPTASAVADFKEAIKHGDVVWHAFPHNAQLEMMSPSLIEAGLDLTFGLDDAFGLKRKRTLSQRDVPGMTKSVIPILKRNNVTAVSIGANGGSTPQDLPPCFVWQDKDSMESILGLFTWPGYGSFPITGSGVQQRMCVVDGLDHALVYNWNGDNAGPFSNISDYAQKWKEIEQVFPNAKIVASTFDNFTQYLEAARDKLPVVDAEVGDTWIFGAPSDPQKLSRMKVINREYDKLAKGHSEGGIKDVLKQDPVLRNATRFALKLGEHTWGKDVKANLFDNYDWKNADFHRARAPGSPNASQYAALESSWWEQRDWGITIFMETLLAGGHPLAKSIEEGFQSLQPKTPDVSKFEVVPDIGRIFKIGKLGLGFDSSGSIQHLDHAGMVWASAENVLLQLQYRTYSLPDVQRFLKTYCKSNASWVMHDYGKPGLPDDTMGKIWNTQLEELYFRKEAETNYTFLLKLSFEDTPVTEYGAAETVWVKVRATENNLGVSIGFFDKTTTRLPETMFVRFNPVDNGRSWEFSRLGEWENDDNVVAGGSKHLYGVTDQGILVQNGEKGASSKNMYINSLDASVVSLGLESAYPSPTDTNPNPNAAGSSFVLWDNLWGTNYIMWWPFSPPPKEYEKSSNYFPLDWNNNFLARFNIIFDD